MVGPIAEIIAWFSTVKPNWEAKSAVATIMATFVALFLPIRMTKREWARQDRIREAEAQSAHKKIVDVHHEVCWAVDRILAYREAAIAMFGCKPVSPLGIEAVRRIDLNVKILMDMLSGLKNRQELSDGALYSAAAAARIGTSVCEQTARIFKSWDRETPEWDGGKAALIAEESLANMAKIRSENVRTFLNIKQSETSIKILNQYNIISSAIIDDQTKNIPIPSDVAFFEGYI